MANFIIEDIKNAFKSKNYITTIIIINVIIYILQNLIIVFSGGLYGAGHTFILESFGLLADLKESLFHFWSYFTYMFFHSYQDIFHVISNMLWLYFIGRIFVDLYTNKRFISLYLMGGVFSGIYFIITSSLIQLFNAELIPVGIPLVGASGAVMAVIIATATLLPNYEMRLIFLGNVKLKYIALASFVLTSLMDLNLNTGGKMAHIGGALFGFFYGKNLSIGKDITLPITNFFEKIIGFFSGKSKMKVVYKSNTTTSKSSSKTTTSYRSSSQKMTAQEIQRKTDEILDKINKSGYDSLSQEEKDFLSKASKL